MLIFYLLIDKRDNPLHSFGTPDAFLHPGKRSLPPLIHSSKELLIESRTDDSRIEVKLELVLCERVIRDELLNWLIQLAVRFDPRFYLLKNLANFSFAFSFGVRNELRYCSEMVAASVDDLLRSGATWTNKKGETLALTLEDILIVAPYNAQVSALLERLPAGSKVGTVDKFQGQEAPVVLYSMATSTPEDAPRGMEFLYSLNRLNVAVSRAQCAAVIVASPALLQVQCKTSRQIELANAFCRYLEMENRLSIGCSSSED